MEKDGSHSTSYKATNKALLYITADATGKITKASVEARTYIQTDEWIAIKDAMLTAQELGLSQGTITELSRTLNTNNLQKSADGFDILVINIDNYRLSLGR